MTPVYAFEIGDTIKVAEPSDHCYAYYEAIFDRAGNKKLYTKGNIPEQGQHLTINARIQHCSATRVGKPEANMYICVDADGVNGYAFDETSLIEVKKDRTTFLAKINEEFEKMDEEIRELKAEVKELRAFKQRVQEAAQ